MIRVHRRVYCAESSDLRRERQRRESMRVRQRCLTWLLLIVLAILIASWF